MRKPAPYERLQEAILSGEFGLGEPLVEAALAQWCGVSRTPVREALTRLEQDGLVVRTSRGLIVRERSPHEILDIYETRLVLEGAAARTAAQRRTDLDLAMLRRAASAMESVDTTDEKAMVGANRRFHRALWQASHNDSLIDLLGRLEAHLARYPATTLSYPDRWKQALLEHAALVVAIEKQDEEEAHRLSTEHFATARDIRIGLWEQHGP